MTIKLPGDGLCDRQGNTYYSAAAVPGVVIDRYWKDISDGSAGVGVPAGSGFTQLIADVTAAQAAGRWITLRISAGVWSPDVVKAAAGTCTFIDRATGAAITYQWPAVWTTGYLNAYQALQVGLAAAFDANAGIGAAVRHVQIAGVMTVDPEVCLLFRSNRATNRPALQAFLRAKGLKPGAFDATIFAAHQRVIDIHAAAWPNTGSMIALNPANMLDVGPDSVTRALQIGDYAVAKLGKQRAMLHNHSLRWDTQGAGYEAIYAAMGKGRGTASTYRGALAGIQTAQPSRVFVDNATGADRAGVTISTIIDKAYDLTARHVELPAGYNNNANTVYISSTDATTKSAMLAAQAYPW